MTEDEIIDGCKKGNSKAQRTLLDQYADHLYSVALRYAVDRAEAKDILQESWINIFKGLSKYQDQGLFVAWMKRIVINVALRKKQGFEKRSATYVDTFFDTPVEEPRALGSLQYDDLMRIVNQLPEGLREVFKMSAIDGIRHKEISEILNIEESTSRVHLSRARKKLQQLITKQEEVEIAWRIRKNIS